jgi:hypothetical protein
LGTQRPGSVNDFFWRLFLAPDTAATGFLSCAPLLSLNHPHFLAPAFLPSAPAIPLPLVLQHRRQSTAPFLQFRAQFHPGRFSVGSLGALALAPHLDSARPMANPYGRRGFVDLLAARPSTANKALVDVIGPDAQRSQTGHDGRGQVHCLVSPMEPQCPVSRDLFRVGYSPAAWFAGRRSAKLFCNLRVKG